MARSTNDRPPQRYWTVGMILGTVYLWFFGVIFGAGAWNYAAEGDPWTAVFFSQLSLMFFAVPLVGYYLRFRDDDILCPQFTTYQGSPAIHFPGEERGMPASALLYFVMGFTLISMEFSLDKPILEPPWPFIIPGLFFWSYTLFAVLGRFAEDGTFLTEEGVIIRARGLRARIPWSSIAGSRTYKTFPFPFDRIAIDLHPGTPREVATTVPWWIGSPRPRRNTVLLTKVQVPGFIPFESFTNPGAWIHEFAHTPPTPTDLSEDGALRLARAKGFPISRRARRRARQRGQTT